MPRQKYTVKKRKDASHGPYYVFWTENGRQRRRSTGLFEEGLARAHEARLNAEYEEHRVFGRTKAEANVTFAYAAQAWLSSSPTDKIRNARVRFIEKPIIELGDHKLRDITKSMIDDAALRAYPNAKPATRRRQFHGPVKSVLIWSAEDERAWCAHPAWKRPPDSKARVDWVTPVVGAKIINAATSPRLAAIFELGFGAGPRASEIAKLAAHDLHLSLASAIIQEPKNGHQRRLHLPPRTVVAMANAGLSDVGCIFRAPGGLPYIVEAHSGGLFNNPLATACQRAGVPRITAHIMRHSWATWFYDQTKDLLQLQAHGGWRSLAMVQRYAHLAPPGIGDEARALGWDFTAKTQPKNQIAYS